MPDGVQGYRDFCGDLLGDVLNESKVAYGTFLEASLEKVEV